MSPTLVATEHASLVDLADEVADAFLFPHLVECRFDEQTVTVPLSFAKDTREAVSAPIAVILEIGGIRDVQMTCDVLAYAYAIEDIAFEAQHSRLSITGVLPFELACRVDYLRVALVPASSEVRREPS